MFKLGVKSRQHRLEHIISDDDFNLNNLSYSINKNKYRDAEVAAMETAFASWEPQLVQYSKYICNYINPKRKYNYSGQASC